MFSKTTQNILLLVVTIALIVLVCFHFFSSKPKTGFVLIQEVYSNFTLKKELEKEFLKVKNARQKVLDSLSLELKYFANRLDLQKQNSQEDILLFKNKKDEYIQKQQTFEEDNDQLSSQYDKEILTQLNQYIKDFGKENKYTYIFGNDNNGALMYAVDAENITKEVTDYINNSYSGRTNK